MYLSLSVYIDAIMISPLSAKFDQLKLAMRVLQAFESPWSLIQANAAYFAACLLSEIRDSKASALYLPQVILSSETGLNLA